MKRAYQLGIITCILISSHYLGYLISKLLPIPRKYRIVFVVAVSLVAVLSATVTLSDFVVLDILKILTSYLVSLGSTFVHDFTGDRMRLWLKLTPAFFIALNI